MIIIYCETCGKRVPEPDVEARRATQTGENRWICVGCSPAVTLDAPAIQAPPPAHGITTHPRKPVHSSARKQTDPHGTPTPSLPIKLYVMAGAGAVVAGLVLVLLFGLGGKKIPTVAKNDAPEPEPAAQAKNTPPKELLKTTEPPVAKTEPVTGGLLANLPAGPSAQNPQPTQALTAADRARLAEKEIEDYRNGRAMRLLEEAQAWFKQNSTDPWTYKAKLTDIARSYATAPAAAEARKLIEELKALPAPPDRLETSVSESKEFVLVYDADLSRASATMPYDEDRSAQISAPFDRVAYFLELQANNGEVKWIYVSMDAFTDSVKKIGIPTFASGAKFQEKVSSLNVVSNVKEISTGTGLTGGNIEFWPNNYGGGNAANIPNASADKFDFGDAVSNGGDYGSMQVHNHEAKQTLFAFNCWGRSPEMGIGNQPSGNPDWTFSNNGGSYRTKRLRVLVRLKK